MFANSGLSGGGMGSMEMITGTMKVSDNNMHTCEIFDDYNNSFLYLWMYIGETIGPLDVHVVGNCSCWPQMSLRVMRVGSDRHIEFCSFRTEEKFHTNHYMVCPHLCRCKTCGDYIVVQLPVNTDKLREIRAICEISL